MKNSLLAILLLIPIIPLLTMCGNTNNGNDKMNQIAEKYIKLTLRVGQYAPNYVDAYFGPEEWKPADSNKADTFPYTKFSNKVDSLIDALAEIDESSLDKISQQRKNVLSKQLRAVKTKIELTTGAKLTFDEETEGLYDAIAPVHSDQFFKDIITKLDNELPGKGSINERWEKFKSQFQIPEEKLDTVFKTAVAESRKRTLKHFDLPKNESYKIEYVKDKSWGGYNWYQGNSRSLVQVNTDFPIYINRAVDLAAHEGYPGHHLRNIMLDQVLYHKNGWPEYSINLLFNPLSPIDEGSANYGIEVAFPGDERIKYEKEVLFPLAGIDTTNADKYYECLELLAGLKYAGTEAARKYINGEMTKDETAEWLAEHNLSTLEKAKASMEFIDTYRGYIINYTLGKEVVADYIESNGGTPDNPEKRWELFKELISNPHTISDLTK